MSLFEKIKKNILVEQPEVKKKLSDAETQKRNIFRQNIIKKAKELKTSPGRLIRSVEKGLQAVDKPATQDLDKFSRGGSFQQGSKYNRQAYATGEPFQPDDSTLTPSGKYPASGKSTLKGRFRYPSVETGKPSIGDVKKRLVSRVTQANIPGIGKDPKKAKEFIDKATKNQGPLSKAKGKESTLYKTLKRDLDLREPTVKGKSGGKLPMVGHYDKNVEGGRVVDIPKGLSKAEADKLRKKQIDAYDRRARGRIGKNEGKRKFDAEIRKKAKLPKSVTVGGTKIDLTQSIPSGTGEIIDPKTGKKVRSNPFSRKELNLQFKADKLELDYGGRFAKRDGLTDRQRRKKLKDLKRQLDLKNPTITSPKSGGQIPATAANLKKYGYTKTNFKRTPKINFKSFRDISKKFKTTRSAPKLGFMKKLNKLPKGSRAKVIGTAAFVTAASLLSRPRNKTKTKTKINNANITPPPNTGSKKFLGIEKSPPIIFNLGGPGGKNPGGNIDFKPYGTK